MKLFRFFLLPILLVTFQPVLEAKNLPTCVYISSYHQGYAWSDELETSLRNILKDHCLIKQFNMDTKRNKDEGFIQQKAKEAKALIDKTQPAVVITSDDNAAKYVIAQYYNPNSKIKCNFHQFLRSYFFDKIGKENFIRCLVS